MRVVCGIQPHTRRTEKSDEAIFGALGLEEEDSERTGFDGSGDPTGGGDLGNSS